MTPPSPLLDRQTASLAPFVAAGLLDATAVHVAGAIARAAGGVDDDVLLAAALAARAPLHGHVCVVLADVAATVVPDDDAAAAATAAALPWPDPRSWDAALRASPAVALPLPRPAGDGGTGAAGAATDPSGAGGAAPGRAGQPGDATGAPGGEPQLDTRPAAPTGEPTRPLVWDGTRLYLERYWRYEEQVAADLRRRAAAPGGVAEASDATDLVLDRLFGPAGGEVPDLQRRAAATALTRRLAVVAGGPGTGKTRTVARLLAAVLELAPPAHGSAPVALAAPTGKAAARLVEAVRHEVAGADVPPEVADALLATEASTIHRLVGIARNGRPGRTPDDPLPHDLVVVDEMSMVPLALMAHLLRAVRPDATLVLVGDPMQLTSVEAGAVLAEIVAGAAPRPQAPVRPGPKAPAAAPSASGGLPVVVLERVHRFAAGSAIASLADAVRVGDADRALALLRAAPDGELRWVDGDDRGAVAGIEPDLATAATAVVAAARAGDAAGGLELLTRLQVLCAVRHGPTGTHHWTARIEALATAGVERAGAGRWYAGRPVVVTANDYRNRLFNGDVGLTVPVDGRLQVAFGTAEGVRLLAPARLDAVDTWWATTVHRSQGSEVDHAVVALPPPPSPVLTRELLYTAVTRARRQVTLVATEASVRTAIGRPVSRASGLGAKLADLA